MRFSRSSGEMISSRFCFSSTPTSRCAAIVSASLLGRPLHGGDHGVVVEVVRQLDVLLEQRHDAAHRAPRRRPVALRAEHLRHDPVEALVFLPLDRARPSTPSTSTLMLPSGQLQALNDVGDAAHRVDVASGFGSSLAASFCCGQEDPLVLHRACSSARVDDGRPMTNGIIMCGKDDDVTQGARSGESRSELPCRGMARVTAEGLRLSPGRLSQRSSGPVSISPPFPWPGSTSLDSLTA